MERPRSGNIDVEAMVEAGVGIIERHDGACALRVAIGGARERIHGRLDGFCDGTERQAERRCWLS